MTTDDEAAVLAAEDRRYRAVIEGDLAALEEMLADELSYTHSNGSVDTKDSYLEKLRTRYYVYDRVDHPVDRVAVVGDCAIVVGRMVADIHVQGTPKHLDNLVLVVWTRARGDWQLLGFAPTVPPAA
ncbi:MAG: nuclear transport factor 2 family protein [Kineosporiaceae bacterium]